MIYKLIVKDAAKQPKKGNYNDWKPLVAEECRNQCVYCAIHENRWGGLDNFHVDHFRPKSLPQFKSLVKDIKNLYLACSTCNRFKSDNWPEEPDLDKISYADPSVTDYSKIFTLSQSNYELLGTCVSANYMILQLYLNRPQLVNERKEWMLENKADTLRNEIKSLLGSDISQIELKRFIDLISDLMDLTTQRKSISNYKLSEIRRK